MSQQIPTTPLKQDLPQYLQVPNRTPNREMKWASKTTSGGINLSANMLSPYFMIPPTPMTPYVRTEAKMQVVTSPDFTCPPKRMMDEVESNFKDKQNDISYSDNDNDDDHSELSQTPSHSPYDSLEQVQPEIPPTFSPMPQSPRKVGTFVLGPAVKSCSCRNTKCLKGYCDCYRFGNECNKDCKCSDCHNTLQNRKDHYREPVEILPVPVEDSQHPKGCHCSKSHCLKKYCECFQAGIACGTNCKCCNCENQKQHTTAKKTRNIKEA